MFAFLGLAYSLYPNLVVNKITIWDAAAPRSSQLFLLMGAAVLIPIILAYTGYVYWLFRGKVKAGATVPGDNISPASHAAVR